MMAQSDRRHGVMAILIEGGEKPKRWQRKLVMA